MIQRNLSTWKRLEDRQQVCEIMQSFFGLNMEKVRGALKFYATLLSLPDQISFEAY